MIMVYASRQGYASGKLQVQPLIAAAAANLRSTGTGTGFVWQRNDQLGSVTCLLEHSCQIFDDFTGMQLVSLLLSGYSNGFVCAHYLSNGEDFFRLALHTSQVKSYLHEKSAMTFAPTRNCDKLDWQRVFVAQAAFI